MTVSLGLISATAKDTLVTTNRGKGRIVAGTQVVFDVFIQSLVDANSQVTISSECLVTPVTEHGIFCHELFLCERLEHLYFRKIFHKCDTGGLYSVREPI